MTLSKSASETSPSWLRCAGQEKRSLPVWIGGTVEKKGRQDSMVKYYAGQIEASISSIFKITARRGRIEKEGDIFGESIR